LREAVLTLERYGLFLICPSDFGDIDVSRTCEGTGSGLQSIRA
jgi:hypothetical protein